MLGNDGEELPCREGTRSSRFKVKHRLLPHDKHLYCLLSPIPWMLCESTHSCLMAFPLLLDLLEVSTIALLISQFCTLHHVDQNPLIPLLQNIVSSRTQNLQILTMIPPALYPLS